MMANIVHHSDWLEEEVHLDFKFYYYYVVNYVIMLLHTLMSVV